MTIDLTEDQLAYLQEWLYDKLSENLDLDEYDMLKDLNDKLNDAFTEAVDDLMKSDDDKE